MKARGFLTLLCLATASTVAPALLMLGQARAPRPSVAGPAVEAAPRRGALLGRVAPRAEVDQVVAEDVGARVLYFGASWCPPCRAMKPELAKALRDGVPVEVLDVDASPERARRFGIRAVPALVVVDGRGEEVGRAEGFATAAEVVRLYRQSGGRHARRTSARRPNPEPWETAVRVRIAADGATMLGSGTIISSDRRSTLILTCAHVFEEEGKRTPKPAHFRRPIVVDLFEGPPSGEGRLRYAGETFPGQALDYDPVADVGLIRIRPGRVLPQARVVPERWVPSDGMHVLAIGCPHGEDATAWETRITRAMVGMRREGGASIPVIECERGPEQGRSGGGLYTDDGYVAGVCCFDDRKGHGLYAHPTSIRSVLDRNGLAALYDETVGRIAPERRPDAGEAAPDAAGGLDWLHCLLGTALTAALATLGVAGMRARAAAYLASIAEKRITRPLDAETSRGEAPEDGDEDLRRFLARLRRREAEKARRASEDAQLAEIQALILKGSRPEAPAPTSAPPADAATAAGGA